MKKNHLIEDEKINLNLNVEYFSKNVKNNKN